MNSTLFAIYRQKILTALGNFSQRFIFLNFIRSILLKTTKYHNCYKLTTISKYCFLILLINLVSTTAYCEGLKMRQVSKVVDDIMAISMHGELRDTKFIENLLSTKFTLDNNSLIFFPVMGINALSAIKLNTTNSLFNNSKVTYIIYTVQSEFQSTKHIAKISIERFDMSICITRSQIESFLPGVDPVVFHSTILTHLPPLYTGPSLNKPSFEDHPRVTYSYAVKSTKDYITSLNFVQVEDGVCAASISIEQDSKP